MSPGGLISIDTSEKKAVPNSNNYSHTSSLHPSLTQDSGVHGPESSTSSGSPSFARDNPFHDPFRDGDKPLGYFYPSSNGVQKGLQPATATHVDPPPATMNTIINLLPPVPTTNADPFAVEVVPNEILSQTPPLPAGLSGLRRGLQIPSRVGLITWGFGFPKVLDEHGVSKPHWKRFKHELKTFAKMNFRQWVTVLAASQGVTLVLGYTAGAICHYRMQEHREHENFFLAYQGGAMKVFEDRWNNDYFHPLGLHVRIEPPGIGEMDGMDVASSKLFRYQQKRGTSSPAPGVASREGDKKEFKYQSKEGRYRMKAARKGRIIVLPFDTVRHAPAQPRTTGSESHIGQIEDPTTKARASVHDSACLDPRQSSSSEDLYRGRLEDEVVRSPSPARAPTTHWGGNHEAG